MTAKRITDQALATLRALRERQNAHGHGLGVLQWEYEQRKAFWLEKIRATDALQKEAGEAALREAGVDPAAGEYTIDHATGEVKQLVAGQWVAVEE